MNSIYFMYLYLVAKMNGRLPGRGTQWAVMIMVATLIIVFILAPSAGGGGGDGGG